jgi:Na+/melibiose symporter-like transporter
MLLYVLDEILYVPALFVTAAVLAVALFWRSKSETYRSFWWTAVIFCLLVTFCYTVYALSVPFYSQQNHSPDNPGGPGKFSTLPSVLTILFLVTCVLIPSFSTLFGLAFLPPHDLRSSRRIAATALIALYVVLALLLVYNKHVRYMADYNRERAKPRQSRFERFKHLRQLPAPQRRRRSQQQQDQQEQQQQQRQPRQQPLAMRVAS